MLWIIPKQNPFAKLKSRIQYKLAAKQHSKTLSEQRKTPRK